MPNRRFNRSHISGIVHGTRRHNANIVRHVSQQYEDGQGCRGSKGAEELRRQGFLAADTWIPPFPDADYFVQIFSEMNVRADLPSLKVLASEMIKANDAGERRIAELRFSDILYLVAA